jgi:ABC-type uncharacterized transport system involved in gliding motility auxiliary subunit
MEKENKMKNILNRLSGSLGINEKGVQFLLYFLIIILINIAGSNLNLRLDLTRNGTYTLSEKSKNVVSNLNENLKIKVLFSQDLPGEHKNIYRYLRDLLNEYEYYGNEYFSYEIIEEKEEIKKQAGDYGIRPVTSREFASDQIKTRQTYMGLVIQQADLVEKIQAVTNPVGLEYTITSRIEKISSKIDGLLKLKKPIELRLYLDQGVKKLPIDGIRKLEKMVMDSVEKINVNNYGKVKFVLSDKLSKEESDAIASKYGLNKLQWKSGRTRTGETLKAGEGLFGLVVESGERFQKFNLSIVPSIFGGYVIGGLDNLPDKIEDSISYILKANKKIGYITNRGTININDQQSREGGTVFNKLLSDVYEVVSLDLAKQEIPEDIDTIIINGPKEKFADHELFKIDQFLMMGKSAVFFIDSFNEVQLPGQQNMFQQRQPMVLPLNTGLEKLLAHYGINVNKDIVLDKNCAKVNLGQMIKDYPLLPIIKREGLHRENIVTKHLQAAVFVKASSITANEKKLKENGITRTKLVSSSPESWLMKGRINFNPMMMGSGDGKNMKSYNLVSLFSGKFSSYFKDKEVPLPEDDKKKVRAGGRIQSTKKLVETIGSGSTRIIVATSSEITRSGFLMYARKILSSGRSDEVYSNDVLLHSFVDSLTGNEYIPEMKSKSLEYSPLDKTEDNTRFMLKAVNIAGVPVIIILAGIVMWRRRESRRKKLAGEFNREVENE